MKMKANGTKRLMAMLLAIVMVLSYIPAGVVAEGTETIEPVTLKAEIVREAKDQDDGADSGGLGKSEMEVNETPETRFRLRGEGGRIQSCTAIHRAPDRRRKYCGTKEEQEMEEFAVHPGGNR